MSEENIAELLHSNLDSVEFRAESEKRVCQQIHSSSSSVFVEAVFDYCLTRSFDLWPLNAIGAISLLSPDYLVPFIEEKVDHFSSGQHLETIVQFVNLMLFGQEKPTELFFDAFTKSTAFARLLGSKLVSSSVKFTLAQSILTAVDSAQCGFEIALDRIFAYFSSHYIPSAPFKTLWHLLYASEPTRALAVAKNIATFDVEWFSLPLHPSLYSNFPLSNAQRIVFVEKCASKLTESNLQAVKQTILDEFEDNSDNVHLKFLLASLERSLLTCEMCALDTKVNELTRRQTNAQLLKQKTAFDEHILSAKIEMLENERKEFIAQVQREKAAMGKMKANETMLECKVRNLTEINERIREELKESTRNAQEQEWLFNKEEYNKAVKSNLDLSDDLSKTQKDLLSAEKRLLIHRREQDEKSRASERLLEEKSGLIDAFANELEQHRTEKIEMATQLARLRAANENLRNVLREKETRIDNHKVDMRNKSKNSSAKVQALEEANRSQMQIILRLQQEIMRFTVLPSEAPAELSQSQPMTIRTCRDER